MNLHQLSEELVRREGGYKSVDIAQAKEIISKLSNIVRDLGIIRGLILFIRLYRNKWN